MVVTKGFSQTFPTVLGSWKVIVEVYSLKLADEYVAVG